MTEKAAYLAGRRNLRREVEVIGVGILLHEVVVGNVQIQRAAVGDEAVGLRGGSGEITVSGVFVGIPETQPRSAPPEMAPSGRVSRGYERRVRCDNIGDG